MSGAKVKSSNEGQNKIAELLGSLRSTNDKRSSKGILEGNNSPPTRDNCFEQVRLHTMEKMGLSLCMFSFCLFKNIGQLILAHQEM